MDARHVEDSLFFIAEHDWRCFKHDDMAPDQWLPMTADLRRGDSDRAGDSSGSPLPEPVARKGSFPSGRDQPGKGPMTKKGRFEGIEAQTRPGSSTSECSPELAHLVAFCNFAHQENKGDFIWLSWNSHGQGKKKGFPNPDDFRRLDYGSTLIALTKRAATEIYDRMLARGKATHIDLFLLEIFGAGDAFSRRSSMAIPPFGGFSGHHRSLNMPGKRAAPWREIWCHQGTVLHPGASRPGGVIEPRQLAGISSQRPAATWGLLDLPPKNQNAFWRTRLPPTSLRDPDANWQQLLTERGWVLGDGWWIGPRDANRGRVWRDPPFKGGKRAKGWTEPEIWNSIGPGNFWYDLQENPVAMTSLPGRDSPEVSILGMHLAVQPLYPRYPEHGTRQERSMRFSRNQWCQRFFTDDPDQATRSKKKKGETTSGIIFLESFLWSLRLLSKMRACFPS
jgi:hypothetical protein